MFCRWTLTPLVFLASLPVLEAAVLAHQQHESSAVAEHSTILIDNDGNWTAHETRPSALLFYDPVSFEQANNICDGHGESLIPESELATFNFPLRYQAYIGKISPSEEFWTNASAETAASERQTRSFICTNSAPLVDRTAFPFYSLPNVSVSSNGTTYFGVRDKFAYRFLGFPYILQPVGNRRFTYPTLWYSNETNAVLNATTYGPDCPVAVGSAYYQNATGINPWGNSEACVLMNIFTAYLPGEEFPDPDNLKPVLFWLHGGGSSNQDPTYDGASLTARADVVVVSVNWRQGNFGGLSFGDGFVDGNYGNADIVAGLQWVRENIRAFGGNPNNVTIFGQSAGGESVIEMIRAPVAKGLFSGAIGMSAAVSPAVTQEQVANVTVPAVAEFCGNATGVARLECLRGLSVDVLLNNMTWSVGYGYNNLNPETAPIIDGKYIVNNSVAAARSGQLNRVNFLIGNMPEEGQLLLGTAIAPNDTDWNTTLYAIDNTNDLPPQWPGLVLSSGLWKNGSNPINPYNNTINVFTTIHLTCPALQFVDAVLEYNSFDSIWYYSNQRGYSPPWIDEYGLATFPVGEPDTPYYRTHSGDLLEVFGTYYIFDQPIRVPEDIGHTNLQQDMWGSFARTGNPNPSLEYLRVRGYETSLAVFDKFTWPEFTGNDTMNIDYPNPYITGTPWQEKCQLVEELFHLP